MTTVIALPCGILMPGDLDIGWRTVWQEARDQGYDGMIAVAWVLRNRLEFRRGDRWATLAQTCMDWLQFSGWREQDANFLPAHRADLDGTGLLCVKALTTVLLAAPNSDPTFGSRHYVNPKLAQPGWAYGHKPAVVIGDHAFYNTVA